MESSSRGPQIFNLDLLLIEPGVLILGLLIGVSNRPTEQFHRLILKCDGFDSSIARPVQLLLSAANTSSLFRSRISETASPESPPTGVVP